MSFFESFTANASKIGDGLQIGASLGSAVAGLSDGGVSDASKKTIDKYADVNARRVAREMRYMQGQARAQMAAQGGMHGSNVFVAAGNARRAEENRQQVFLNAQRQKLQIDAQKPTGTQKALGFASTLLSAGTRIASSSYDSK